MGFSIHPCTPTLVYVCANAAVFACRKPPQIKFKLDFGKALGSAYTAKAVRLWLDPFLRETLADLIVWPNRIVVPILPEEVTGPLYDLMLRCVWCWSCQHAFWQDAQIYAQFRLPYTRRLHLFCGHNAQSLAC